MTGRRSVTTDPTHTYGVRIFFGGVSRAAFDSYIASLRSTGYALTGIVYYRDSTAEGEARAKARAAAGDVDAVRATRAPRVLTITVPATGAGEITLDIDGLTEAENGALNQVAWPASWADRLPAPADCRIDDRGLQGVSDTSLQVYCLYDTDDLAVRTARFAAYVAALEAHGFTRLPKGGQGEFVTLQTDRIDVKLFPDMGGRMQIEAHVRPDTTSAGGWPADWVTRVPPPDNCRYGADTLQAYGPNLLGIGCVYADPDAANSILAAYAAKLGAAGFVRYQPAEQYARGPSAWRRGRSRSTSRPACGPTGWWSMRRMGRSRRSQVRAVRRPAASPFGRRGGAGRPPPARARRRGRCGYAGGRSRSAW